MTPASQAITELEKDTTVEQLMAVSNRFERIALAEKDSVASVLLCCLCQKHCRFHHHRQIKGG